MQHFRRTSVGGKLRVHPSDLFVAQLLPLSSGIHVLKVAVECNGHVEVAEYKMPAQEGREFELRGLRLTESETVNIRASLTTLAEVHDLTFTGDEDYDLSDYQDPLRRLIGYWHRNREVYSIALTDEFFSDMRVADRVRVQYSAAFERAWGHVLEILRRAVSSPSS